MPKKVISGAFCPAFFIWALLIVLPAGCASRENILNELKSEMIPPARSTEPAAKAPTEDRRTILKATREDILDGIRSSYSNFKGLTSTVAFAFTNPSQPRPQNCQAQLDYERSGKLYVHAYRELVPNFFTLAAKDGYFWFYVPTYNTVYRGPLIRQGYNRGFEMDLDPVLLEASFLAAPILTTETADMEEQETFYVLSIFKMESGLKMLRRKLWINRRDLSVERETYFTSQGIPDVEFIRKSYEGSRYFSFPRKIEFRKLKENKTVLFELKTPRFNTALPPERFDYKPPEGAVIETVG